MVKATMESWHGRKVSPVYNLMPNLQEPDWKSLRIGDVREFWEQHDAWEERVELARRAGRIGDVLVLADEAPVAAFRAEAWIKAGEALRKAERFKFALEHLERGLEIEPTNLQGLREKGMCLQRLALAGVPGHSLDRARAALRSVLDAVPERSGDLGAARPRGQGRVDRRVAQPRQDAGADARRSRLRGCAAARRDRQLRHGPIAQVPATTTPASTR